MEELKNDNSLEEEIFTPTNEENEFEKQNEEDQEDVSKDEYSSSSQFRTRTLEEIFMYSSPA